MPPTAPEGTKRDEQVNFGLTDAEFRRFLAQGRPGESKAELGRRLMFVGLDLAETT